MNNSTCPKCGKEFECGISAGKKDCWCFALPNIVPTEKESHCYCPDCLKDRTDQMQMFGGRK